MRSEIAQELLQLNTQFYQTFAEEFSATRQRLQPGVLQVVEALPPHANVLDLGSGNGELASVLASRGHQGSYLGLDFSPGLVKLSRNRKISIAEFRHVDLTSKSWASDIPSHSYEYIFCFAMMHHIPGEQFRSQFLTQVSELTAPNGRFTHSHWQLLNSSKLRARIQPWDTIGLSDDDVGDDDYLMDWRRGGRGLRYVHNFTNSELRALASEHGFRVGGLFTSDGDGNNLGLYHIWERVN